MEQPLSDDSQRGFTVRRVVAIALVGLLLFSAVGGVIGGGVAAAQQDGGDSKDKQITKQEFRKWLTDLEKMSPSEGRKEVVSHEKRLDIFVRVYKRIKSPGMAPSEIASLIKRDPGKVASNLKKATKGPIPVPNLPSENPEKPGKPGTPGIPGKPGNPDNSTNSSNNTKVDTVIKQWKANNLRYSDLSKSDRQVVISILSKLSKDKVSEERANELGNRLSSVFATAFGGSAPLSEKRMDIVGKVMGVNTDDGRTEWKFKIPTLVGMKLEAIGDTVMKSVPKALETAYEGIWSTPVPQNSGWHQLLGRPTNFPFQTIHADLLQKYIYPLMSKLLGIALILIAGAILVNPFSSTYRAKDLFINFVTGVTLYSFSWLIMTTMHAVTDMAIQFVIPNPSNLTQSVDNLLSLGAAPVALYLFGSSGLFSTLFALGLEFWFRHVLLTYLMPFLFGALMLIAWVAPHGRLRKFASMGLWQYVNVLLWPLIPAIIFRAVIAVNWNFRVGKGGVIAALVLITLFLCMIAIPIVQTWFFLQVPGAVQKRVQSNVDAAQEKMESAAGRVPNPLPSMSDIKDSATAAMATNEESPGGRADDMIDAASISTNPTRSLSSSDDTNTSSGLSSSGTLDTSLSDDASTSSGWSRLRGGTTASKIRSLHLKNRGENMTAEAMKAEYFDRNLDSKIRADGGTEADNYSRHVTNL